MAGVIEESFHLRCFLRSVCSWWADISLCSMKLMVGGMLEKRDCRSAGESVTVGVWDVFKIDLALVLNLLTVMVRAERGDSRSDCCVA